MPGSDRAFRRNAPQFAGAPEFSAYPHGHDYPLVCRFHEEEEVVSAFIRFKGATKCERIVTLGNGCQIYVFRRVLSNPEDSRKITTAESSYFQTEKRTKN